MENIARVGIDLAKRVFHITAVDAAGAVVERRKLPASMMGNVVMTQALRNAGVAASGHGFRSSFKGWARQHDVDELLSEFALAHVEGSATVAAYARDDLLEKRRPVMQAWADCISG